MSISVREWALAAGISKRAMLDYRKDGERRLGVISRLKKRGLIRSDKAGRREGEAGAFVLVLPRAEFHHSSTGIVSGVSGETLRAPRLRWSAPVQRTGDEVICSVVKRLGKGCGAVIDALERAGGSATVEQLAAMLHKSRARDLRRREIDRLEKAGVVECSGEIIMLVADWLDVLDRERESAGEIAAYQRDMSRYAREREAYANRQKVRPQPVAENPHAGDVGKLEGAPKPNPEVVEALRVYLDRNQHRRREMPSWLCVTLWAENYLPSKPSPEAVALALAELEVAA